MYPFFIDWLIIPCLLPAAFSIVSNNDFSSLIYVLAVLLQFFVRLDYIRKCFTQKGGIFVLEEYSTDSELFLFLFISYTAFLTIIYHYSRS